MRIYFFTLLIFTVLCSKVYADEQVDSSTDIVEKQNKDTVQKLSEVIKKDTTEIKPFRGYFGIGALSVSGKLDEDLISKETRLPLTFSQPEQQGTAFALIFGGLSGKHDSGDLVIYSGSSKGSKSDNDSALIVSETFTNIIGFEVGGSYNFNNQGIHRGVILGGGLGFQNMTITNKTSVLNAPIVERKVETDVAYLSAKLGYGYLLDNKLYLTTFLKVGLPFSSNYRGSDEEYLSSGHLFLNPGLQVSLQSIF